MQESGECLTLANLPAPTRELQTAVVKAAKENSLLTFAHATNLRETLLVLDAGVDALAHQFFDQPHPPELIERYKEQDAFLIPTLTAISSMMGLPTAKDWASKPQPEKLLTATSRHVFCDCMKISKEGCNVQFAYDCVKALKAEGIDIIWYVQVIACFARFYAFAKHWSRHADADKNFLSGTDSGPSIHGTALGAAVHLELSLYVEHCGFSPVEALQSATSVAAKRLRLSDRGRIAVGKRADLLLVRGDPTVHISDTLSVENVWKQGVLCDVVLNK